MLVPIPADATGQRNSHHLLVIEDTPTKADHHSGTVVDGLRYSEACQLDGNHREAAYKNEMNVIKQRR